MSRVTAAFLAVTMTVSPAFAGGFAVLEQSVRGLGQAFAGNTTGFGDGSSAYFNPAAMTLLARDVGTLGGHVVFPRARFDNRASRVSTAVGGGALHGSDGGNAGEPALIPNAYLVKGLLENRLKLGFAVNSPFGLLTRYDRDWVGRYHAVKSDLLTINVNPSIGYRINDFVSVGGGISAMYAEAELSNAIDFGSIGVATLGAETAAALQLFPQSADGFAIVEGDDWGMGYHLGVLLEHDRTRAGIHFRSKIDLDLRGRGTFQVPANASVLQSSGAFTDTWWCLQDTADSRQRAMVVYGGTNLRGN